MSKFEIKLPKLGESIEEATILKWHIKEGDFIEEDLPVVDLATDKVDSEIPSPVAGMVEKILFPEGSLVAVGKTIAIINLKSEQNKAEVTSQIIENQAEINTETDLLKAKKQIDFNNDKFFSPLVKNIAQKENLPLEELLKMEGSGANGRLRKNDLLAYLQKRNKETKAPNNPVEKTIIVRNENDTIVPMSRMRKMISEHMINSVRTSAHVTSVVEADVSNLVKWRNKMKDLFENKYHQKLTYMPVFVEATAKALREFPQVNASVNGENIVLRKNVNIGIAVALPDWNLIVPVVKNADMKNIAGLASEINSLAENARNNKLQPDDIQGGTFSISNFGSFKNLFGTPVINQPQVAILATGSIQKVPAVIETKEGDMIAIRHKMFLALSYDHRIVDGALGGAFLRYIADYLENFDPSREV